MIPGGANHLLLSDAGSPSISLLGTTSGSAASLTYAACPLGTPLSTRKILVALAIDRPATVTALTVGGIAGRQIAVTADPANGGHCIWVADVPTGTAGDVVVTCSTSARCAIAVYRAVDFENEVAFNNVYGTGSVTVNVPQCGFAIAMSTKPNLSASTWTGLTMDVGIYQGSQNWVSVASGSFPTGSSGLAVTASGSATMTVFSFGND